MWMIRMGKGILSKEISGYIHATKIIAVWQKGRANKGQDDATWGQKSFIACIAFLNFWRFCRSVEMPKRQRQTEPALGIRWMGWEG